MLGYESENLTFTVRSGGVFMAVRNLPAFKTNPFLEEVSSYRRGIKRTVVKSNKALLDLETGEIEDGAEIVQQVQVDSEQFVKLYTADLKKFFSLTPKSQRILQLVLLQVQKHKGADSIMLNVPVMVDFFETRNENPPARQTFYLAIEEMISKGFLARSAFSSDMFYINPAIFFNGDRVRLVKEYQIIRRQELSFGGNANG